MNITELRKANSKMGWSSIPESCPERFVASICERRSRSLITGSPIPMPDFRGFTGRSSAYASSEMSFETMYKIKTGREYVSPQQLEARLYVVGQQIKADAPALEEQRRADERFERERANLNAELFPWDSRN